MSVYENVDYLGSEATALADGEGEKGIPRVVDGLAFQKRHDDSRQEPPDNGEFWLRMKELSNDCICTVLENKSGQDLLTPDEIKYAHWASLGELGYARPVSDSRGEVCGPGLVVIREDSQRVPANKYAGCGDGVTHITTLIADVIDPHIGEECHGAEQSGCCVKEGTLRQWTEATLRASAVSDFDHVLQFTERLVDREDGQGVHERAIYASLNGLLLSSDMQKPGYKLQRLILRLPGAEYGEALEVSRGHDGTRSEARLRLVCVGYVWINDINPSHVNQRSPDQRTSEKGYPHISRHVDPVQNSSVFGRDVKDKVSVKHDDMDYAQPPVDTKADKELLKKENAVAVETNLLLSDNGLDGVTSIILQKRKEQAPLRLYDIVEDRVESLNTRVVYAALSYVWRQWTAAGLKQKLREFSTHSGLRYVWVDAWCINQDNIEEKETEIRKMGDYYMRASLTLALLPDYDPPWALNGRRLEHPVMPTGLGCQLERWRKVEWNTRVWTLQEAALSANVVLRTKRGYMNLQTAEVVAESCRKMFSARPAALYPGSREAVSAGVASVSPPQPKEHLRRYHWAERVDTSRLRMRDVVTMAAGRKCQEGADQIYGLVALAVGQEKLEVDYSRDVNDIVAAAFHKWKIPPLTLFSPTIAASPGSCWQAESLADVSPDVIRRLGHWEEGIVLAGKAIILTGRPITSDRNGRLKYGHIGKWHDITGRGEKGELLCKTQWEGWVLAIPGYISGIMTWHRTGPATLTECHTYLGQFSWKLGERPM